MIRNLNQVTFQGLGNVPPERTQSAKLFEKKDALLEVLSGEAKADDRVQVYIGRENLVKVMDNSTLVFKAIVENGKTVGAIGIIGPTRMNYRKVIATIDSVTRGVTDLLADGNKRHGEEYK